MLLWLVVAHELRKWIVKIRSLRLHHLWLEARHIGLEPSRSRLCRLLNRLRRRAENIIQQVGCAWSRRLWLRHRLSNRCWLCRCWLCWCRLGRCRVKVTPVIAPIIGGWLGWSRLGWGLSWGATEVNQATDIIVNWGWLRRCSLWLCYLLHWLWLWLFRCSSLCFLW